MKIKVFNRGRHPLPSYATTGSAAVDLYADGDYVLYPQEIKPIATGLHVEIPIGWQLDITPRSGLASRGVTVMNAPGLIDSDYRGEIMVIIGNFGDYPIEIQSGQRIAQAYPSKVTWIEWDEVDSLAELTSTGRGDGGLGSTGV